MEPWIKEIYWSALKRGMKLGLSFIHPTNDYYISYFRYLPGSNKGSGVGYSVQLFIDNKVEEKCRSG